jgi:flagellar motor switch protein FliN/FliY
VAENPNEPSDAPRDFTQGGFNQEDIDALLKEANVDSTGEEPPTTETGAAPPPADAQTVSEADLDALINAAGGAGETPEGGRSAYAGSVEPPTDTRVDTMGRPLDEPAAAVPAAIEEELAAPQSNAPPPEVRPYEPRELADSSDPGVDPKRVTMLNDVKLRVRIQLGRTRMLVEDVLKLGEGSVVELDKLAGDPVDVLVNDRLIARGEVLVLNDNFCVRISEVLSHDPHRITV